MRNEASRQTVIRAFVDTPGGQIHLREAGPRDGGAPPLLCLHQSPSSSLTFAAILPHLAKAGARGGRRVLAVDTPGFGESFRPVEKPGIADYTQWIADIPQALGLAQVDVLGYFTGAAIGTELALLYPDLVRRVVMVGPPWFTEEQRQKARENAWPARPDAEGGHLMSAWRRVMARYPTSMDLDLKSDLFQEFFRGGPNAIWGEEAVAEYDLSLRLPGLTQPLLVLEPEGFHGDSQAAHRAVPHSRHHELAGVPALGLFHLHAPAIAALVTDFLDQP
ncbi:alpha/beta fold hydrolase [Azospirillum sp. B4]|uniref:alpha/beta fold hydrolase n=1 Tax=Azospirillum sp. B4 TaxID=95605 RepID=UPI000344F030|nr:alpha/beta hydrolase [Azospirillum sp. B4]